MFIRDFPDLVFLFPPDMPVFFSLFFLHEQQVFLLLFCCFVFSFVFSSGHAFFFLSLSHAFRPKAYLGGGPRLN